MTSSSVQKHYCALGLGLELGLGLTETFKRIFEQGVEDLTLRQRAL